MNKRAETSAVTVTFLDGEVKVYKISAGPGVAVHLAQQCGQFGSLVLLYGNEAYAIPVQQIREWKIEGVF